MFQATFNMAEITLLGFSQFRITRLPKTDPELVRLFHFSSIRLGSYDVLSVF